MKKLRFSTYWRSLCDNDLTLLNHTLVLYNVTTNISMRRTPEIVKRKFCVTVLRHAPRYITDLAEC